MEIPFFDSVSYRSKLDKVPINPMSLLSRTKRILNKSDLKVYLTSYLKYRQTASIFKNQYGQSRLPPFPEVISENLVKRMIYHKTGQHVIWLNDEGKKTGDLLCGRKIFEVKCFSQSDQIPATFSPQAYWDELYILNASQCEQGKFQCQRFKLPSDHHIWLSLPATKTETVADKIAKGHRPKISPQLITEVVPEKYQETIFDGYLSDLFSSWQKYK